MPRVVIAMSVFNEAQHLGETIPAVFAQTMCDWRLVVLDNGSTDASYAILRGFEQYESRMTVFRAEENIAPGRVANLLAHVAASLWPDHRWMLGAGADDIMAPDYLEALLMASYANPRANLIFSPWEYIDGNREPKRFPDFDPETCHAVHQIPAWSAIRRDLWESSGGHDETMIAADWEWVVRNREKIVPVQLDKPYIRLRVRDGARKTQSEEVHWPTLHRRLCELADKPVPNWARGCNATC